MNDKLNKKEKFLKYDLAIKKSLYNAALKEQYRYNESSLIEYSNYLFKIINDIEYYINNIFDFFAFNFTYNDKKYFNNFIKALKDELIKSGYDYDKLKKIYEVFFSNMSEELINEVGENCVGYSIGGYISLSKAKSLNEILHVIHQTIVNNEDNLTNLPKLNSKINKKGYSINLYGKENFISNRIFNDFPLELSCGHTQIVSLGDNNIIMMVRDRGHALSIEINKENDKYYVKYFIPKICNYDMINQLKGVNKVQVGDKHTVGIFETTFDRLSYDLIDFISKVPTDNDMFVLGGIYYDESNYQR